MANLKNPAQAKAIETPTAKPMPAAAPAPAPAPVAVIAKAAPPVRATAERLEAKVAERVTAQQSKPKLKLKTPPKTTITPPAAKPAAIVMKEAVTMEATIKNNTDKAQALFAEANDRAKAAMETTTRAFDDINAFGKGNLEAFVESSKIAAKGIETLGQDAAEYTRKSFDGATAALRGFASVKSPAEFFKLQSDYVRQSFDSLVAETAKNTESMLKLAGAVAQPISNRVAVAVDKAKVAA